MTPRTLFIKTMRWLPIFFIIFIIGSLFGSIMNDKKVMNRCMKYFGNQGYPANYYCKLFVGEIKARDE